MLSKLILLARSLPALLLALAIPYSLTAAGPAPVDLRSMVNFVILSGAGITTTGGGIINGNIGASPITGAAIGVPCAQLNGTMYAVDAAGPPCAVINAGLLTTAKGDLTTAYNDAAGRTPVPTGPFLNPNGGNIGGLILAPGLYKFTTTTLITGSDVTLVGGANDVWIFQCGQDLQLGSGIKVILAGGAQAKNIFWQVGTSAVLGTSSVFKGTILADQSITMNTSSTMEGRALAFTASVVFNGSGATVSLAPEIGVEQPPGTNLVDGVSTNDFGLVLVGTNATRIFTITNSGDANLTGLGILIDGLDAASFSVTTNAVAPVGPNGSTTFAVRFTPLGLGLKTAALHIANNDSDENPFDIVLTGTGAAPEIGVEQPPGTNLVDGVSTNNFGPVLIGATISHIFTVTNSGNANLTLTLPITFTGVDAALFTVTVPPNTPVLPGGVTTFTVRFAPLTVGAKTAALQLVNNDSDEGIFDINLTGTGALVPAPEIAVEQPVGVNIADGGSKGFGPVLVGSSTSLIFTITNSGTANLTLTLPITFTGVDAALFTVTVPPNTPVLPGGVTTFTVRFAPLIPTNDVKTAALQLVNNDSDEGIFNINLTGTGTGVFVTTNSSIALNPQTGLFEQTVQVTNSSSTTVPGVRLLFQTPLPADVLVYNASGTFAGIPFWQHNFPLAGGAEVVFLIEYRRTSRLEIPRPAFVAEMTAAITTNATGPVLAIVPTGRSSTNRFLIDFPALPGGRYAVQYSSDMTNWSTANPIITAPANRVQWYDDGPPKTESKPTDIRGRFYRIIQLP